MSTPNFYLQSLTDTPGTLGIDEDTLEDAHQLVRDLWPLHECLGTSPCKIDILSSRYRRGEIIYTYDGDDVLKLSPA